jgi:hypothetical protein
MSCIRFLTAIWLLMPTAGILRPASAFLTHNSDECPRITVKCPTADVQQGVPLTFTASISGGTPHALYTFNWTISAGTISSGQGTSTITLDTTGLGGQNITVTVEVGGVPQPCAKSESCGASVSLPPPVPHPFDRYGDLKFSDEKTRLDNLAITLQQEPGALGYIVIYSGKQSGLKEARDRARRAKRYVVNRRDIEAGRVILIYGGRGYGFSTMLLVVPGGAKVPKFGQVIK